MSSIKVFPKCSREHANLRKASAILTALSEKDIEETYFDYGQNWMWTTIIAHDPRSSFGSYQALCPRDHEKIVFADSPEDLLRVIGEILPELLEWKNSKAG